MGYDSIKDIDIHSIHKGAASYLALLPGGPPPAAICLQGGWTIMGHVKDIYLHQMQAGDGFTRRCISLLNMTSANFASSPAFFDENSDKDWIKTLVHDVFPNFEYAEGMGRILWMCLASLIHHRDKVLTFDPNHTARTSISIFLDPSKMQLAINKVKVIHAWESNLHLTGIPPHIKALVNLHAIKVKQSKMAGTMIYKKVMGGLTEYFEAWQIGGREMTEAQIKDMIAQACKQNVEHLVECVEEKLESLAHTIEQSTVSNDRPTRRRINTLQTQENFLLQTNPHDEISRLPNDFQFPKGSMYDCWIQWNVGHSKRQPPALTSLKHCNVLFVFVVYIIFLWRVRSRRKAQ
jgi:hypothetical protein